MVGGHTGKILRINLSNQSVDTIRTSQYEQWIGGHGMGSAIFWDLCADKTITDGYDPRNIITIMVSPLAGTLAPATSRTEMQAIGVYSYPVGWFTRSNFGGTFATQLKFAGWDGIVIEGKAENPVWISIVNDQVSIHDAGPKGDRLWGLTTWRTQQVIWEKVTRKHRYPEWLEVGDTHTLQRPAVAAIGPAGENLARIASVVHGAGSSAGQGGFGAIWGAKNLKAISVLGTGSVPVADPKALVAYRLEFIKKAYNVDDPIKGWVGRRAGDHSDPVTESNRALGCPSCVHPCRRRYESARLAESQCIDCEWYTTEDKQVHILATDLMQQYGINVMDISFQKNYDYLTRLYQKGLLGPGKQIDSGSLLIDEVARGTALGVESFIQAIAYKKGIGADLAEGMTRAAIKWGRYEEDVETGFLRVAGYGLIWHWWLPHVYWGYGSILSDRDVNEHCLVRIPTYLPADVAVRRFAEKMAPYHDPFMFDYNWQGLDGKNMAAALTTGIYSESKAKQVAWQRHWSRFWKQSVLYCDTFSPVFNGGAPPDYPGFSPDWEVKFFNVVTGKNFALTDGMELGRKIFNLDRAIWVLQGRHRDQEVFNPWMYKPGTDAAGAVSAKAPVWDGSKWDYQEVKDMFLDKEGFETWKTKFYKLEGWDAETGWPERSTLEGLGLGHVADELASKGKLGGSRVPEGR